MNKTNKTYRHDASSHNACGQGIVTIDFTAKKDGVHPPVAIGCESDFTTKSTIRTAVRKSEGRTHASVAGCNANNANAGRTLNANNSVVNSNNNYAGGFAAIRKKLNGKKPTSRPTRSNKTDNRIANGGCGQGEYRELPFWGSDGESNATLSIWDELIAANKKRNLKGLRRFYLNREIAIFAVMRTAEDRDTEEKKEYYSNPGKIADELISEIENWSYRVRGYEIRKVDKKHKTDKERDAKVYTLYDRCMQNFILTIIEVKLRNKVIRNNYSNIIGRSILCNDRRYCMMTRIRHASKVYNVSGKGILLTDIKKFYESVDWKILLGTLFETIKDPTTRWLLVEIFSVAGDMPIGCCLSPLFADVLLFEFDEIILRVFHPDFMACFGDNRCFIADMKILPQILTYQKSFYEGRYNLHLKKDYQIRKLSDGFRFCKTWYNDGFVMVRSEMRRRAIRAAENPQSFAGYNGLLQKADSKHLLFLINNNLKTIKRCRMNKDMEIMPFRGTSCNMDKFVGKRVAIANFRKIENHKEVKEKGKRNYYYDFQIVVKETNDANEETLVLYHAHDGSFEVCEACDLWLREPDKYAMPQYVTIQKEGNSRYFEEFHITNKEACQRIVEKLDIKL